MMNPISPAQLSPMGRNLLKQHLMQHAMQLHQKKIQSMARPMMQPHVSQFVPQQPMLGGGMQAPAPAAPAGMPGPGAGGF